MMVRTSLHIAMGPWFAIGHRTSYLHLSKFQQTSRNRISFVPTKSNPHIDGLLSGAEIISDTLSGDAYAFKASREIEGSYIA